MQGLSFGVGFSFGIDFSLGTIRGSTDGLIWSMSLIFSLLIFGPDFVVHGAINRGRGEGLLARFILNITIC